jgi:hypothetical protein
MSAARGVKRLRKLDPAGIYDFNHLYFDSGEEVRQASAAGDNAAKLRDSQPCRSHRRRRR